MVVGPQHDGRARIALRGLEAATARAAQQAALARVAAAPGKAAP
ncbi:MAG: hypothetical protein ACKOFI_07620 [Phycisphaerales bacterium]